MAGSGQETIRRIDGSTGTLSRAIPIPEALGGLIAVAGALWMVDCENHAVARIDPDEGRVVETIVVDGRPTWYMWEDGGLLWIEVCTDLQQPERRTLVRIDPEGNRVVGTVEPWAAPTPWLGNGHVAHGSLWSVVAPPAPAQGLPPAARLDRMDRGSGLVLQSVPLPAFGISALTKDSHGLWLAGYDLETRASLVIHIDAASAEVDRVVTIGDPEVQSYLGDSTAGEEGTRKRDQPSSVTVFACSSCGLELSHPVQLLDPFPAVVYEGDNGFSPDWMPSGYYSLSSGPSSGGPRNGRERRADQETARVVVRDSAPGATGRYAPG